MKPIITLIAVCSWFIMLLLAFHALGQQPWMKTVKDKKNPNFLEVQQALLQFTLFKPGQVSLKVYNQQGSEVASLYKGEGEAGKQYTVEWQAGQQSGGGSTLYNWLYLVRPSTSGLGSSGRPPDLTWSR